MINQGNEGRPGTTCRTAPWLANQGLTRLAKTGYGGPILLAGDTVGAKLRYASMLRRPSNLGRMDYQQSWFDANAGWVGFAGLIIGVSALITGFLFYWWSRRPKRLGWQFMSQTRLPSVGTSGSLAKLVLADGQEVERPNLSVIRVGNTGKAEIPADAFDGPIRVSFNRSKLIGVALYDRLGLGIRAEITQIDNTATFTPSLLNKGEWFEVQFLTDGDAEVPQLVARVAGHDTETADVAEKRNDFWMFIRFFCGFMFFAVTFASLFLPDTIRAIGVILDILLISVYFFAGKQKAKAPGWANEPKRR